MGEMFSAPKPGPKPRGRSVKRSRAVSEAARKRDGVCLYGLMYRGGCVPGIDPHHIVSFGSDPTKDVLENIICLCRKHHNDAEENRIDPMTLKGILYHFYGYGPTDDRLEVLDGVKAICNEFGLKTVFQMDSDGFELEAVGFLSRYKDKYTWEEAYKTEFFSEFAEKLTNSQRMTRYG